MQSSSPPSLIKKRVKQRRLNPQEKQQIIDMATKPLKHAEIAEVLDCNRSTVTRVLLRYGIEEREYLEDKEQLAKILLGKSIQLIKSVTEDDIKKMPVGQRFLSAGILYDKYRLETNQSTSNISSFGLAIQRIESNLRQNKQSETEIVSNNDDVIDIQET